MKHSMAKVAVAAAAFVGMLATTVGSASAQPSSAHAAAAKTVVKIAKQATPAQAAALDAALAADSHGCSGDEVSNNSYVHVCFVRDGDVLWVKDDESNGYSAYGQIEFYDAGSWYYGYCYDPYTAASGKWASCSFSEADENTTAYYRGYDAKDGVAAHFTAWQAESTS